MKDLLPTSGGNHGAYERAQQAKDGSEDGFAFVASTDDVVGGAAVNGDACAEADTGTYGATNEGVAAAMAGAAKRNTLEVLPQNGLVGGFGVEDDGVVGERSEFTGERFGIFLHDANLCRVQVA